jgi:transcriptional regulator with XRE-family HTH domain
MTFGDRLQALRKARGLSQEQLADEMQISRQAVSKWESGQSEPDTDKIVMLSKYFGVTTDYLLIPDNGVAQPVAQVQVSNSERENARRFITAVAFLCAGLLTIISVIIAAAINVPSTTSWLRDYPSKLWFLIYEGNGMFQDSPKGLGLGPVFNVGLILAALGVVLLLWQYFYKANKTQNRKTET